MHIPSSMLNGAVCPVTLAVGGLGVTAAGYLARKSEEKPSPEKFAAVTALIFALQMLNFPVQAGTSGHLLGGALAAVLLGTPFAVLAIALVLGIQAVFFGDGGLSAFGANFINMGLIGAGLGGMIFYKMKDGFNRHVALAVAAWISVMAGAVFCSVEVAASGAVSLQKVLPAMLSVHALIGLGEAALTVAAALVLQGERVCFAGAMAVLAACASPLASGLPDGLERVSQQLSILHAGPSGFLGVFSGYDAFFAAGLAGTLIVCAAGLALGKVLVDPKG